jgi:nicotinate phosphoribosyltransferase
MSPRRRKRLDPSTFRLSPEQIRAASEVDGAGIVAQAVLEADARSPRVTVEIAAERAGVVCGVDEAIALIKVGAADWEGLAVHALYDGDRVEAGGGALTVEGAYPEVARLSQLAIGVLARRTRVCTNARRLVEAARPKPVAVFPGRHDHWLLHAGDAYAASVGGAVAAERGVLRFGGRGAPRASVVPHSLIAAYGGNSAAAARRFAEGMAGEAQIVVPVDYENDSVRTALAVARELGGAGLDARLWGVQLATSEHMVDRSILPEMGAFPPAGVNAALVWHVRNALDAEGLGDVRILASGGFTVAKIRAFEEDGVPVDAYGVGAALLAGEQGFGAHVVAVDGAPQARAGRPAWEASGRLERVR